MKKKKKMNKVSTTTTAATKTTKTTRTITERRDTLVELIKEHGMSGFDGVLDDVLADGDEGVGAVGFRL